MMNPPPGTLFENTALVGFYGFKGGLGRTLAAVHMAHFYSRMGKRVLLVDADLEAPGLSFWNPPRQSDSEDGLVQLLIELSERGTDADPSLMSYVRTSDDFFRWEIDNHPKAMADCAPVHLMPTGLGSSSDALDRYIASLPDAEDALRRQVRQVKTLLESSQYDVVLVDSRTGLHQIAATILTELTDLHVLVTGPSRQAYRGLVTALEMFSDEQLGRSVYAMSPVPWQAAEQLARASGAIRERIGDPRDPPPHVVPISWHPLLALDEHLITVIDPASVTAHDYQTLFVELETLRGFGIDRYTESVDALLDLLKLTLDPYADVKPLIDTLSSTREGEDVVDIDMAFADASDSERAALTRFLQRNEGTWSKNWRPRSGFAGLLVWEIIRRLRELALLDSDAATALWAIVVRRNQPSRYASSNWTEPEDVGAPQHGILGQLHRQYMRQFGHRLSGLHSDTDAVDGFVPEITLNGFVAAAGGMA
jgi:cellulose biosynthesis protein BcsQ